MIAQRARTIDHHQYHNHLREDLHLELPCFALSSSSHEWILDSGANKIFRPAHQSEDTSTWKQMNVYTAAGRVSAPVDPITGEAQSILDGRVGVE